MKIQQFIELAESAYPGDTILNYWDEKNQCPKSDPHCGDTLAEFIVREMYSVFGENQSYAENAEDIRCALKTAICDLQAVLNSVTFAAQRKLTQ